MKKHDEKGQKLRDFDAKSKTRPSCSPTAESGLRLWSSKDVHGKTATSGLIIKWSVKFRLGSLKKHGVKFEAIQFF